MRSVTSVTSVTGTAMPLHPCQHPLTVWLAVTGLQLVAFALAFAVGWHAERRGNWWFVDPCSQVAKIAFTSTWALLLPLLAIWTVLGMSWLVDTLQSTPECLADNVLVTPTICSMSQAFCGIASIAYLVFVANVWDVQRCRKVNAIAIRSVEDDDLIHRWGQLKPAA